jgi:hypothetical protein
MVVQTRAHALCSRLRFRLRSGAGGCGVAAGAVAMEAG